MRSSSLYKLSTGHYDDGRKSSARVLHYSHSQNAYITKTALTYAMSDLSVTPLSGHIRKALNKKIPHAHILQAEILINVSNVPRTSNKKEVYISLQEALRHFIAAQPHWVGLRITDWDRCCQKTTHFTHDCGNQSFLYKIALENQPDGVYFDSHTLLLTIKHDSLLDLATAVICTFTEKQPMGKHNVRIFLELEFEPLVMKNDEIYDDIDLDLMTIETNFAKGFYEGLAPPRIPISQVHRQYSTQEYYAQSVQWSDRQKYDFFQQLTSDLLGFLTSRNANELLLLTDETLIQYIALNCPPRMQPRILSDRFAELTYEQLLAVSTYIDYDRNRAPEETTEDEVQDELWDDVDENDGLLSHAV